MLKYLSKFTLDILPSVVATIIGAYIVNHYIVAKPTADAPAAVSSAAPKAAAKVDPKVDSRSAGKSVVRAPDTSSDPVNIPEPGVRAKGISEKAVFDRSAAEQPQEKTTDKPAEKSADRPAETASIPADTRRHQPTPRERVVARTAAPPAQLAAPAAVPAAVPSAAPVEAAVAPDDRRDANDLARAAIERLRTSEGTPRAQEAVRLPETPRTPDTPRVVAAEPVRPLPPPIMVSTPANEAVNPQAGSSGASAPYVATARIDDPRRPTPPADIPSAPSGSSSRPLDLRAEAVDPSARERTTVAEDMLSAAKSVFHAVLPK